MKLRQLQLLWKETTGKDGVTPEPSEARFRAIVLTIALLAGPPLLLLFYYKQMFPGLTNPDALDFAQLGRNLSAGRGFVTNILRPLALTHGSNPLAQPDVTHGPLFPFLQALAFGLLGAKDTVAAIVSGVFYLLTIPVLYLMGLRVFNRGVALLVVLIYTFNALMLEYAASGMHITLYVFLMTCLLLVIYNLAANARDKSADPRAKLPKGQYILAGVLAGLLYLTDPIFFWILPFVAGALYWMRPTGRVPALAYFLAPLCVLILPWMARNAMLTGNPVFGLRGMEVWMNTRNHYPGYNAYRNFPDEMIPGVPLFKDVAQKILLGGGTIIQAFPQVTASWVLAFFLPCLLFSFTDQATNTLRRTMVFCFLGLLVGSLFFRIQMPLFVAVIPTMLVFSVAYLLHLIQQAQLKRPSIVFATVLLTTAVVFPLISDMTLIDKTKPLEAITAARALGTTAKGDAVCLSDQPWIVAWYADRPSVWLPATDARIADVRKQFPSTRWLFLTADVRNYSPEWLSIHDVFQRWNMMYRQAEAQKKVVNKIAISGKGDPLIEALAVFTSVAPAKDASVNVAVATIPVPEQKVGLRSQQNGPQSR